MQKMFFGTLLAVALASPAYATAHNESHALNWLEQIVLFGPSVALAIFALIVRGRRALYVAGATLLVPIAWAIGRVWLMDGPWNLHHLAKHHVELGYPAAAIALGLLALLYLRRRNSV